MYLSDIEIIGFKSFAQKTKLKFAPGLSAVVGPNGCGKTNVVDAIRWVLGEKKASTLRSDVMENVIFNGTRDRKPLSLAEVSITFDNTRNILPTDYNQIVVSRRLFRNGDSEYLLNNTHCRLKDILDLFMDTGIGSDSYSVIELKMVDAILSGKVDDRRAMFEEAAGIKKYKARRKESMKKLDSVTSDMERIQDILQEVRKNVNSLSRQAAKTKRYNQYLGELKTLEIMLFAHEFAHFNNNKKVISEKLKVLSAEKIKTEIALSSNETEIAKQKEILFRIEQELTSATENERILIREIADLKQKIAVSSEKTTSFDSTAKRLTDDILESENSLKLREQRHKDILLNIEEVKSRLSEHTERVKSLSALRDTALAKVRDAESKVNNANNEISGIRNKIESLNNILNRSKERKINLERKIQQLSEDKFRYSKQIEEINEDNRRNKLKLPELKDYLQHLENELKLAFEKKISLESEIEKIKQKINDNKNALGGKKASLDFLNSLVDSSAATKFLSDSQSWQTSSEKVILGEIIGTDDEYRLAVLTALGDFAHSFVVENQNEAFFAINLLRDKAKGKSGFICLDIIPEVADLGVKPNISGVIGWLSETVRVENNIRNLLRAILGKTLIVENSDTANRVITEKLADVCVTTDGTLFHSAGIISGGSVSQKEGQWVGKKERISKLKKEIGELSSNIDELQVSLSSLNEELAFIEISKLQQDIKLAENEIAENSRKSEQLKLKLESLTNNINFIEDNTFRLQDEISEITNDDSSSADEISELTNKLTQKQTELLELKAMLADAHSDLSEKQNILRDAELESVEIESEIKSLDGEIRRIENEIQQYLQRIKSRKDEFDSLDLQKDELAKKIETYTENLSSSEVRITELKNKIDILSDNKKSTNSKFDEVNNEYKILMRDFDKLKENIHQLEIQETEANSHIQNITERALEQYETDIETTLVEDNPEFDIQSSKTEILSLKERLSQLGNVNFMALEEYDVQNERLEFYEKQMGDLEESGKILRETIEEINSTAERNFKETFDKIQSNFKLLFKKLFGEEGEADLKLESDDLLESDIVITAKPPNKRPHSIEMLSGGEKTLTAIALLFAIYLVKPSPFCILDEVDAPLDDANIEKFVHLIKEFSIDTQFLIVTHNKKTMEAADTLYGVTMQEDGVSKVVAVRVDNEAA
ncbi:MAG: chromosome segregation protein SMC [Candidatus Kapabacteria bacterium]|nr:chromosome segregation protein SMC [Ignavibacteriota bacterium]MCW5883829.1 chromosome segregation protein SMC [Candidatus Kapabacteria bacterium]